MDYNEARETLRDRDSRKIGNNTYLRGRPDGGIAIKLHDTDVVTHYPKRTVYNSGGWRTVTTKARMNQYGNSRARVWSNRGIWYLYIGDNRYRFADGITVSATGHVTHAAK